MTLPSDMTQSTENGVSTKVSPALTKYTEAEQELRVKLAAAYRIVARKGWDELIYNHISVRVTPEVAGHGEEKDTFLINPFGLHYDEITASSLVRVDLDGNIVDPGTSDYGINYAGFVIHSALHAARQDVNCVMHTHDPNTTAVASLKCGLLPVTQNAQICGPVAYHDYEGLAVSLEERGRLATDLGDKEILFLRNHGVVTAASTLEAALFHMHNVIKACDIQVKLMSAAGGDLSQIVQPPASTFERTYKEAYSYNSEGFGKREFAALLRALDRDDTSYRT